MKMSWKIFCMAYLVVMLTVGFGGFLLVEFASASIVQSRVDSVLTSNEYAGKMFVALAEQNPSSSLRKNQIQNQIAKMVNTSSADRLTICLLEETRNYHDSAFVNDLSASQQNYAFIEDDGASVLQAVCRIDLSDQQYYVETLADFSNVLAQREDFIRIYRYTVLATSLISGIVLLVFSFYITRPLKKLSQTANQIAGGNYQKRIPKKKQGKESEEIAKLSNDFNKMADAVEENIQGLKNEIERRETFIADFTHELKTPMTAVIGYADLLRSYHLDEEEQRNAADIIYREGKRLEALSMKLLDIIVLKKEDVILSVCDTKVLFDGIKDSLLFLEQKYGVSIIFSVESALVWAEPTLLLSLVYNLADNACKASTEGETVKITGKKEAGQYSVSVIDHGRGILKENLEHLTDPFFMEDKSRSRKQGGAGLGLTLCQQIAKLHHTVLSFDSAEGVGTSVVFRLLLQADDGGEC